MQWNRTDTLVKHTTQAVGINQILITSTRPFRDTLKLKQKGQSMEIRSQEELLLHMLGFPIQETLLDMHTMDYD